MAAKTTNSSAATRRHGSHGSSSVSATVVLGPLTAPLLTCQKPECTTYNGVGVAACDATVFFLSVIVGSPAIIGDAAAFWGSDPPTSITLGCALPTSLGREKPGRGRALMVHPCIISISAFALAPHMIRNYPQGSPMHTDTHAYYCLAIKCVPIRYTRVLHLPLYCSKQRFIL